MSSEISPYSVLKKGKGNTIRYWARPSQSQSRCLKTFLSDNYFLYLRISNTSFLHTWLPSDPIQSDIEHYEDCIHFGYPWRHLTLSQKAFPFSEFLLQSFQLSLPCIGKCESWRGFSRSFRAPFAFAVQKYITVRCYKFCRWNEKWKCQTLHLSEDSESYNERQRDITSDLWFQIKPPNSSFEEGWTKAYLTEEFDQFLSHRSHHSALLVLATDCLLFILRSWSPYYRMVFELTSVGFHSAPIISSNW
jgi:hypothetical protein